MTEAISLLPDAPGQRTALSGQCGCESPHITSMALWRPGVMSFRSCARVRPAGCWPWPRAALHETVLAAGMPRRRPSFMLVMARSGPAEMKKGSW